MIKIVGVRFRNAGKVYYFDPKQFELKSGDHVIVETARGVEYGTVIGGPRLVADDQVVQPLKAVLREATAEDTAKAERNRVREKEALAICNEKIRKRRLDMKLIDAEYTFDNNKLLFYFTADGRIDFRELVKDLAAVFRMRIELRQVGVRDETKILGGIGICGRVLCCHSYLADFAPVSIRMAKEQNLSLNPTKISGVCGRLMCCLKNEQETYEYLNSRLPGNGDAVLTADGRRGTVQSVNVLRQRVRVLFEEGGEKEAEEFDTQELQFRPRRRRGGKGGSKEPADEELSGFGMQEEAEAPKDGRQEAEKGEKKERRRENRGSQERRENRPERGGRTRDGGESGLDRKEPGEGADRRDADMQERRGRRNRRGTDGQEAREGNERGGADGQETRGGRNRRGADGQEAREGNERGGADGQETRGGRNRRNRDGRNRANRSGQEKMENSAEYADSETAENRENKRNRNRQNRGYRRPRNDYGAGENAGEPGEPS